MKRNRSIPTEARRPRDAKRAPSGPKSKSATIARKAARRAKYGGTR